MKFSQNKKITSLMASLFDDPMSPTQSAKSLYDIRPKILKSQANKSI
jgi:hypothetical protein